MGDKNYGHVHMPPNLQKICLHESPRLCVEGPKRFVHKKDAWSVRQGSGNAHTLLHPPRKLVRVMVLEIGEANHFKPFIRFFFHIFAGFPHHFGAEGHVARDRAPRKQGIALKDHAAPRTRTPNFLAVQHSRTRGRGFQTGQDSNQGGFSTSGRSHDRDELTVMHVKGNILQCLRCPDPFAKYFP